MRKESVIKDKVITKRRGMINYIADDKGRLKKFKPWLGDLFSFLDRGLRFEGLKHRNGALLYFKAHPKD